MQLTRPLYWWYERRLTAELRDAPVPAHVGVILDGHRRHARAEGLADYRASYRAGLEKFFEVVDWCRALGIGSLTAWALSQDNLGRPPEELAGLFEVLAELFEELQDRAPRLDCQLAVIGRLDLLPDDLVRLADQAVAASAAGTWRLTIAVGYGGRQEIVDAVRGLVDDLVADGVAVDELSSRIDEKALSEHMYAPEAGDVDLVLRTSGESRLSGFLLWQTAYAELAFLDPYWPAFRRIDLLRALRDYARRDRRYGL